MCKFLAESIAVNLCGMTDWRGRAKARMRELKLSQETVAERFGVTQGTIGHWLSGRREPETLAKFEELAKFLKFNGLPEMLYGEPRTNYNVSPPPEVKRRVPVISWVAAGKFCHSDDPFPLGVADEWVNATASAGPRTYALRVDGDSMEPRFPDGCTIIVDPDWEARHKSYVVVRLEDSDETTFKQLIVEGGKRYLKPLNSRYPIIELMSYAVICGVVRQSLQIETFD